MSFHPASAPPPPVKGGSGISAALRTNTAGDRTVMISITAAAWERFFGPVPEGPRRMHVGIGSANHAGTIRLEVSPSGKFTATPAMKGSSRLLIRGWDILPAERIKAAPCELVASDCNGVIFRPPNWAQPKSPAATLSARSA